MTSNMYPDNVLGLMYRILDAVMSFCQAIVQNLASTPLEIMQRYLQSSNLPDWLRTALEWLVEALTAANPLLSFTYNLTLFDLLLGSGVILILLIGIIKYFGDVIGL